MAIAAPPTGLEEPNSSVNGQKEPSTAMKEPLRSFDGPVANRQQTKVTLFNRAQLIASGLIPQLTDLINLAFASQQSRAAGDVLQDAPLRLREEGQFLREMGHAPETFIYIIQAVDTDDLVGTAYASRYEGVEEWPEGPGERTWARLGVPDGETEAWELHLLAVNPGYRKQGLANYLMDLVDAEITRLARKAARADTAPKKFVLYISTAKQHNAPFYEKRGFIENYAVDWPPGHYGSPGGFTVAHMDRQIRI